MRLERDLPFLTADLEGIPGRLKMRPEDFRVDEIPLYEPSGQGDHVYFGIEKRSLPTIAAIKRIANHLGVRPSDISSAGLKDALAVTTQTLSLERGDEEKLIGYDDTKVRVLWTSRHTNRLKTGHLAGNRFDVKLRGVGPTELGRAQKIFDILIKRGVPNYFGVQRFGCRGDTPVLGEALVRGDTDVFLKVFLGSPQPMETSQIKAARDAFDAGEYDRALQHWPRKFQDQRRSLIAYAKNEPHAKVIGQIDKWLKRFYVSAFQSLIFNEILAKRIETIDKLIDGDIATKHCSGGIFLVESAEVEQPRCDAGEISPTAMLPGTRVRPAEQWPGEIEQEVLDHYNVTMEMFSSAGAMKSVGARRALRYCLGEPYIGAGEDEFGQYIQLKFTAPAGSYATVLVEELTKVRLGVDDDD